MIPLSTIIITKIFAAFVLLLVLASNNGIADAFCTFGTTSSQGGSTCQHQHQPQVVAGLNYGHLPLSSSITGVRINNKNNNNNHYSTRSAASSTTRTFLVSEDDVLEAVESAETLWAGALEARKTANALVDEAEEEAESSAETAKGAENIFQDKSTPITMEQLVQVDTAAKASLGATTLVNEATKAMEEADQLESEAEEALKKSEELLDQHLIDFPNSSFAE